MYRAKLEGFGKHMVYEADMHAVASDRAHLEGKLRRAVQLGEFEVHYQPIVWLATGEASVSKRWCAGAATTGCGFRPPSSFQWPRTWA